MDDLISRTWLLAEYDKRHKGPPGGARKLIEEAPPALGTNLAEVGTDCISRKALINKFEQWQKQDGYDNEAWNLLVDVITEIKNMPLATDINVATKLGTNLAEVGTDAISRQAAINAIDECYCGGEDSCGEPWIYKENAVEAINMIEPMPPAQPKRGKWIHDGSKWTNRLICSECGYKWFFDCIEGAYCPNCGAEMEGTYEID